MGLLSGVGPALKGLFGNQDFGDSLSQAHAFLDDDYGTGMNIAARRFQRRRRGSALDAAEKGQGSMAGAGTEDAAALAPPIGAVVDGHRYIGGNPQEEGSWQPLGGAAIAAAAPVPDKFGRWA